MEISNLDNRDRKIAISAFKESASNERSEFEAKISAYKSARTAFLGTIKECLIHSERYNSLHNLIRAFGGEVEGKAIEFEIEEITKSNIYMFLNELNNLEEVNEDDRRSDERGDNTLNRQISESVNEDREDDEDEEDQDLNNSRGERKMGIKPLVIEMFKNSIGPLYIADIVREIRAQLGEDTRYTSISNSVFRLADNNKFLIKLGEGQYDLADRYDESGNKRLDAKAEFSDDFIDYEEVDSRKSTLGLFE
ncbi:hypothetical protein SAMN05216327_104265 [Dyadobacter sp. SG02]|uniref:hypothetical protein n=1 Tax=Dyadobacter sp. SG02 TaxID=1855291 RepID=UPI0008C7F0F3|nr:hypothetical protein [Dyadobacter sp. SG02]SEI86057.1 hypothetical protein SAMN05216327_104265 [Dyadobacter sp. SG02]